MKREKTLKLLSAGAVICAAFAFGTMTYTANAAGENEAAANPYESLMLETGASVRYADTAEEMGFSYRLKMPKAAYETVKDNGAVYGIFLAPQDYYAEHPFNSVKEIERYYDTENETPAAGKAKLYDYQGVMGNIDGNTEYVYFRGSLLGVLDGSGPYGTNNLTRDFRAVGYVKYQTETDGEYTYKFVQAENAADNIRSMAYVAEKAIEANTLAMENASVAEKAELTAKNDQLKKYYIKKVEEPFGAAETGTLQRIYNCEGKTLTLPNVAAVEAAKANTYWKDKYEYTWQLVAGETKIDVTDGAALSDKQGIWNLVCTATKKADGTSQEVYSQPYQITDLGATTVNGQTLTTPKGDVMIKNADGSYQNEYDSSTDVVQYYPGVKATGDFTFNAEVTVTGDTAPERKDASNVGSGAGFVFSCGTGKELTVFTNKVNTDGKPRLTNLIFLINTTRGGTMMKVNYFAMDTGWVHMGQLGASISFIAKRFGNELSFYRNDGTIIFTFRADGTVVSQNGIDVTGNSAAVGAHVGAMLSAGKETAFGVYREYALKGAYKYEYNLTTKDNDGLGEGLVNGLSLSKPLGNGLLIKQEDGSYQNNYSESGDILQYVPSMRKTGDFTFNAEVTVTGDTKPERKDANNVGSGVGFVISCGKGKEIAVFSNKVQQDKLVIKTNASRNGSLIYLSGFANVNSHLGELGAGIKFSVKRVGNTLEIYDKNGKKGVTINADGTIKAETGYGATTNATVQTYLSGMLSAGNETVFGIYREYALKGEYNWKLSCN